MMRTLAHSVDVTIMPTHLRLAKLRDVLDGDRTPFY